METKVCKRCSIEQPLSNYWLTDRKRGYLSATCKECDKAKLREYYAKTPAYRAKVRATARAREKLFPKTKEQSRRYNIKSNHGLSMEQYNAMRVAQHDKCALCGSADVGRRKTAGLIVDHCHDTGRIRGLLCHPCNTGLGGYEKLLKTIGVHRLTAYLSG